jgi:hypothetical protein
MAAFFIDCGFGCPLTRDEAKEKIRKSDEAGLFRQFSKWQERAAMVRACCWRCLVLHAMTELGNQYIMTRSAFSPIIKSSPCHHHRAFGNMTF